MTKAGQPPPPEHDRKKEPHDVARDHGAARPKKRRPMPVFGGTGNQAGLVPGLIGSSTREMLDLLDEASTSPEP